MEDTPRPVSARVTRERRTVAAMVDIYCRAHHGTSDTLCGECATLLEYCACRLDGCRFGAKKTPFEGGRHARRNDKVGKLETHNGKS